MNIWGIIFRIWLLTSIPFMIFNSIRNSTRAKIFFTVLNLCFCSVLLVIGIYTNETIIRNIGMAFVLLVFMLIFKKKLDAFENEVIKNVRKAQQTKSKYSQKVFDAEYYTVITD